jgi:hypothetical protein
MKGMRENTKTFKKLSDFPHKFKLKMEAISPMATMNHNSKIQLDS